jgi:SAM-dependent methyltransferase
VKSRSLREYFEKLHATSADPWSLETSSYERKKYKRTLNVLNYRRYRRALEVGSSIGVFTAMLAPLCDEVLAVDISQTAVAVAKERLEEFPHVQIERRTLPEETPEGPFDLIVVSEVLYYWPRNVVLAALQRFEEILIPDGVLLAVHHRNYELTWRRRIVEEIRPPFLRQWMLRNRLLKGGDELHELLLEQLNLTNTIRLIEPAYRLDLFEKK